MSRFILSRTFANSMKCPDTGAKMTATTANIAPGSSSFWIAMSINPTSNTNTASFPIFELGAYVTNGVLLNYFNQHMLVYLNSGGPALNNLGVVTLDSWSRIFVTFNQSDLKIGLYINGSLIGTSAAQSAWNIVGTTLTAGFAGSIAAGCAGFYQDVQVGVGSVPVLADVQADYYQGVVAPGCTHRWKLDQASGTSATDSVGSTAGTLGGTAIFTNTAMWFAPRVAASGRILASGRTLIPVLQNLLVYSEQFDQASWTKSGGTVTADTIANPVDGLTTADTFTASAGGTFHYIGNSQFAVNNEGPYTFSCYVKRNNNDWIAIMFPGNGSGNACYFNTNTGLFGVTNGNNGTNLTVTSFANGWYRISATFNTVNNGGGTNGPGFFLASADGTNSFAAAGTEAVYLFGAQMTQSNYAGTYVPTTTPPVTTGTPRLLISAQ